MINFSQRMENWDLVVKLSEHINSDRVLGMIELSRCFFLMQSKTEGMQLWAVHYIGYCFVEMDSVRVNAASFSSSFVVMKSIFSADEAVFIPVQSVRELLCVRRDLSQWLLVIIWECIPKEASL